MHQLGEASPGPARYNVPGELAKYGLDQKIANVKVPKKSTLFALQEEDSQGEASAEGRLPRIDSSPL